MSPSTDTHIKEKYAIGSLNRKSENKLALQKELGWPAEPKRPVICLPAGMTEQLGGKLLTDVLPGVLSLETELLIVGKGSDTYGALFTKLAKEQPHRVHIVTDSPANVSKMLAAADMALFLTDERSPELAMCLAYGVVPIALEQKGLENYDPVQEAGNAFTFAEPSKWHCFASLVRACETYKLPFDWRTIQKHCMEAVQ